MRNLIALLLFGFLACNNSATVTEPNDVDHTENKDTSNLKNDSTRKDSIYRERDSISRTL